MSIRATHFLLLAVAASTIVSPASAASGVTHVTPTNMSSFSVGFTVTAKTFGKGAEGTEHEVVVFRKTLDPVRFTKPLPGELVRVTQTERSFGFEGVRTVKMKRIGRDQLVFRFTANPEEVSRLSFEVGFPSYSLFNGKRQWMPSADFYCLHLRDFAPKLNPAY